MSAGGSGRMASQGAHARLPLRGMQRLSRCYSAFFRDFVSGALVGIDFH